MARPKFELTDEHLEQIAKMAGVGLGQEQIAYVLGISHDTLTRRKKDTEAVLRAIKRGQANAEQKVAKAVFDKALNGDMTAAIWWEKTRAGRSERVIQQHEGKSVEINIGRAGPATQDQREPPRRPARGAGGLKAV